MNIKNLISPDGLQAPFLMFLYGFQVIAGQLYVSVEIAKQLIADTMRLDQIEKDRKHQNPPEEGGCLDTGCLLQIVIFGILALIGLCCKVVST